MSYKSLFNWTDNKFDEELGPVMNANGKDYRWRCAWSEASHIIAAAKFLAKSKNANVLDIGSGVGKFAIIAGHAKKKMKITGVELQKEYVEVANNILARNPYKNVSFINEDFVNLDISKYTGFYLFNPFVMGTQDPNYKSWKIYQAALIEKLGAMPIGTRLVVNCLYNNSIPDCYVEQGEHERLHLLIKEKDEYTCCIGNPDMG